MDIATYILYAVATFFIASVPYSLLMGFAFHRLDIRQFGDGNPGATNLYKATGSRLWYILGVLADGFKGLFPVGIVFWYANWPDWVIVLIGTAAIAGHAFSPFLRGTGGKAVATTGGIWTGINPFEMPFVLAVLINLAYRQVQESDWAVILWWLCFGAYLLLAHPQPLYLSLWASNGLILLYRHRAGLNRWPTLRRKAEQPK